MDNGPMGKGPKDLAGDGQDSRRVFSFIEEDRLIGSLQFARAGALCSGWLTLLTAAATAVHEGLTQSLEQEDRQKSPNLTLKVLYIVQQIVSSCSSKYEIQPNQFIEIYTFLNKCHQKS